MFIHRAGRVLLAHRLGFALLMAAGAAAVAGGHGACGWDDVGPESRLVGGRCTSDDDCVKRCLKEGKFPGGYCTVECATDGDCPGGAACVAINGGTCLARCQSQTTNVCDAYGAGYQCLPQTSQSGDGQPLACVGR